MSAPDALLGQPLFGGYAVTRQIGRGGMGAVYLAENTHLGKKLAVKVLLPERSVSPHLTARFLAEARAASALRHRNIIDVIDASQLTDGRHYILMEYLEGETLSSFGRRHGPLPIATALAILCQVCAGLEAAHQRGIIHRDLKPANLFITPRPDHPLLVKILDFGIAKLEDPTLAGDVETRSQTVAGTPAYMSPEQARAMRDVDARTDVYAVAVIAYEMLTASLPYTAGSIGELVHQQSHRVPPSLAALRDDVPRAWSELLELGMAIDVSRRIPSVRQLAEAMIDATPRGDEIVQAAAPLLGSRTSTAPRSHTTDWSRLAVAPSLEPAAQVDNAGSPPGSLTAVATPAARAQLASSPSASTPSAQGAEREPTHSIAVAPAIAHAARKLARGSQAPLSPLNEANAPPSRRRWWWGAGLAALAGVVLVLAARQASAPKTRAIAPDPQVQRLPATRTAASAPVASGSLEAVAADAAPTAAAVRDAAPTAARDAARADASPPQKRAAPKRPRPQRPSREPDFQPAAEPTPNPPTDEDLFDTRK